MVPDVILRECVYVCVSLTNDFDGSRFLLSLSLECFSCFALRQAEEGWKEREEHKANDDIIYVNFPFKIMRSFR